MSRLSEGRSPDRRLAQSVHQPVPLDHEGHSKRTVLDNYQIQNRGRLRHRLAAWLRLYPERHCLPELTNIQVRRASAVRLEVHRLPLHVEILIGRASWRIGSVL